MHRDQAHACYDSFCVGRDLACVGAMTQSACAAYLLVLTVCTASLLARDASLSLAACGPNRFVRAATLCTALASKRYDPVSNIDLYIYICTPGARLLTVGTHGQPLTN